MNIIMYRQSPPYRCVCALYHRTWGPTALAAKKNLVRRRLSSRPPGPAPPTHSVAMAGECLYQILGIDQSATDADIKKAYRVAALSAHPDKNPDREAEAAEHFKKVQHAYSVLSDPHERAWYDSHRSQILRSGSTFNSGDVQENAEAADATAIDLFACFSATVFNGFTDDKDGFYGFYGGVFDELWQEEAEAMRREGKRSEVGASFGGSGAVWETVKSFYAFWESFVSAKSFAYTDKWNLAEAPNREVRRLMEKDNKKERAKVRKDFNGTVRELVAFVRKRDPRVVKRRKEEEEERARKEEERIQREKDRKKARIEDFKEAKMMREQVLEEDAEALDEILRSIEIDEEIEESERRKRERGDVDDEDSHGDDERIPGDENTIEAESGSGGEPVDVDAVEANEDPESDNLEVDELYCAACRKPFRTVAQKSDHERSKKHKSAVAKLRKQLLSEDKEFAELRSSVHGLKGTDEEEDGLRTGKDKGDGGLGEFEMASDTPRHKSKKKKKQRLKQMAQSTGQFSSETAELERPEEQARPDVIAKSGDENNINSLRIGQQVQNTDAESADAGGSKEELSKKQKRKLREQKKKAQENTASKATSLTCNVCKAPFPTRNRLMRHVESSGHALHVPQVNASSRGKR